MRYRLRRFTAMLVALAASALLATGVAGASGPSWTTIATDFESPLFGLAVASADRLLVADAGAGPTAVRLPGGNTSLVAPLAGVTDVLPTGPGQMMALTSPGFGPNGGRLFRVSQGRATFVANISEFEAKVDPAEDGVDSNPFDLARLPGGNTLVADAAGNSILIVDQSGKIDWVATLPQHTVATEWLKRHAKCPAGPVDICGLPRFIDADPVATTVAIGPDGFIYAGELTGFPATPGTSRVWRIDPTARHAKCGSSPACTIVNTGPFTSIIDINFGPDGTAYVVEFDEASWLGWELGIGVGGTVNACQPSGLTWLCTVKATGLPIPTAVAIDGSNVYVTLFSLFPDQAEVARLH